MNPAEDTYVYHFTPAKNLPGILQSGYLFCKHRIPSGSQKEDISHYDIQRQRRIKRIESGSGGVLHDYVPFYFAPRSPMMYDISKGNVAGYEADTTSLIYIVSSVRSIRESGVGFVFSDGHPTKAFSRTYDDTSHLDKVDWDVM